MTAHAHWLNKVDYVSALSIWAVVSGHWSVSQAACVEVNQEDGKDRTHESSMEAS